jgi:hypothetical protein
MKAAPSRNKTATISSEYAKNGDDEVIDDESEIPL